MLHYVWYEKLDIKRKDQRSRAGFKILGLYAVVSSIEPHIVPHIASSGSRTEYKAGITPKCTSKQINKQGGNTWKPKLG